MKSMLQGSFDKGTRLGMGFGTTITEKIWYGKRNYQKTVL